jgi:hypothetical protein
VFKIFKKSFDFFRDTMLRKKKLNAPNAPAKIFNQSVTS